MAAQSSSHKSLMDIQVGIAISFDNYRSVVENGYVPSNYHPIGELLVSEGD